MLPHAAYKTYRKTQRRTSRRKQEAVYLAECKLSTPRKRRPSHGLAARSSTSTISSASSSPARIFRSGGFGRFSHSPQRVSVSRPVFPVVPPSPRVLSGLAATQIPFCSPMETTSHSGGATATMGLPAARIPYILLGTTTPSRPRLTVITWASAAASTDGTLLAGKNGRNRTFGIPVRTPRNFSFCAPSPTNTNPTPVATSFPCPLD